MSWTSASVPEAGASPGFPVYFERMQMLDVDDVMTIEDDVYPHPWTRGNFIDSINSGYDAWVVRNASRVLVGYFLVMLAVDEAHLLNVSVRGDLHGQGIGRTLLDKISALAHDCGMKSVLLEVRPSNTRALAIYRHCGFLQVGLRKAYYPAANNVREDAVVMRRVL